MAFRVAKDGLLGGKRPSFRDQKTTFCNTIRNTLIIKQLQSNPSQPPRGEEKRCKTENKYN